MLNYIVPGRGDFEFYLSNDLLDPWLWFVFSSTKEGDNEFYRGEQEYKSSYIRKRYTLKIEGRFKDDLWLGDTGK